MEDCKSQLKFSKKKVNTLIDIITDHETLRRPSWRYCRNETETITPAFFSLNVGTQQYSTRESASESDFEVSNNTKMVSIPWVVPKLQIHNDKNSNYVSGKNSMYLLKGRIERPATEK